jgi:hypothetical protein
MKSTLCWRNKILTFGMIVFFMLLISSCSSNDSNYSFNGDDTHRGEQTDLTNAIGGGLLAGIEYITDLLDGKLMGGSIQGKALELAGDVTTFAGQAGNSGSFDSTGISAKFRQPYGITTDGTNLYVTDRSNHTIRKIVIATGVVTTLAGTAGASGTTDDTGTAARFREPTGITTDGTNLYVSDKLNHLIRKIVIATGEVTTMAGTAGVHGTNDGTGTTARFYEPYGITTDGTNLYVADSNNHTVRKIVIATAEVTTLAGTALISGTTDGTGTAAQFHEPRGITTDGTNLYVADSENNTIRKIVIATREVTTYAGDADAGDSYGSIDAIGTAARFRRPVAITSDGTNFYVADYENYTIRKIVIATQAVTTIAGSALAQGTTDGNGAIARFWEPSGVTTDGISLFVVDRKNHTIRKID